MAQKSSGPQQGARKTLSKDGRKKTTVNSHLKDFEEGEKALVKIDNTVQEGRVHMRFHGKTVTVTGQRGDAYEVEFKEGEKTKTLYVKPVHLQKVEE